MVRDLGHGLQGHVIWDTRVPKGEKTGYKASSAFKE